MKTQYASTITPPPPNLSTSSGSLTSDAAGTYSVWLYCRNRAGVTEFSDRSFVTAAAGQALNITLPAAIDVSGGSYQYIGVVAAKNSDRPTDGCVVATYKGVLPATVTLDTDEKLKLNGAVDTVADLPQDPVLGTTRYVGSVNLFLTYSTRTNLETSQQEELWLPNYPQSFNPYVLDTTSTGGADVEVSDLADLRSVIMVDYAIDGSQSEGVGFWLVNNTGSAIPQGSRIRIAATTETEDLVVEDFKHKLQVVFLGYVDITTGELITDNLNVPQAINYEGLELKNFALPQDLLPNQACYLEIYSQFNLYELGNSFPHGSVIKLYPYFAANRSHYDPLSPIAGNYILATGDRRRVIPNDTNLSLLAKEGSGSVAGYSFKDAKEQQVIGLTLNTPGQKVVITPEGDCYVNDVVPLGAAIRALVSTEDTVGYSQRTTTRALYDNQTLAISLTIPNTIRHDYPDVIAGVEAVNNADYVRVIINHKGQDDYQYWDFPLAGEDSKIVEVGLTAGTPTTLSLSPEKGLFDSSIYTISTNNAASIFDGTEYEIRVLFGYSDTVTAISHDPRDGCLKEINPFSDTGRDRHTFSTNSLANAETAIVTTHVPSQFLPISIHTNVEARIRAYPTVDDAVTDRDRDEVTTLDSNLIFDVVTESNGDRFSWQMNPAYIAVIEENTVAITVTNKSSSDSSVEVELVLVGI